MENKTFEQDPDLAFKRLRRLWTTPNRDNTTQAGSNHPLPSPAGKGCSQATLFWLRDYSWVHILILTNRTQYVKFHNLFSDNITTNTGSPQGSVLSPVLFSIYTNVCRYNEYNLKLIKFADDSCMQGLISSHEDNENNSN